MKMAGRTLVVFLVAGTVVLGACSSNSGDTDGGTGSDVTPDAGPTAQVGDPCEQDADCQSNICHEKVCKKPCQQPSDCDTGEVCSGDSTRSFCNKPTYNPNIGQNCAITAKCPDNTMKCLGGADDAEAYCTAECTTEADCPPEFYCRELSDKKTYCYRRGFCARCQHDAQCGTDGVCAKLGSESFCTYECTPGKTDCPPFTECKAVDGKNVCVHLSGSCVGGGNLCDPCISKDDCQATALCLTFTYTHESFCSQSCPGSTCPASYDCVDIATSATEKSPQCAPCSPLEICSNGEDDNCDGQTDESNCVSQDQAPLPKCVSTLNPMGEVGATLRDFSMVGYIDSNADGSLSGEKLRVVKLSDYSSRAKVILFNVSAGWCGPCQLETQSFKYLMDTYGSKGLMIYQVIFDSDKPGVRPTVALLDAWVNALNPAGAVGIDPNRNSVVYNTAGTTPLNMLLDAKTFKVLDKFNAFSLTLAEGKIKTQLGL